MDSETFTSAIQAVQSAHWNINYTEFCRRAGFREDDYSESKWTMWRKLNEALNAFDHNTLARLAGIQEPRAVSTESRILQR